MAEAILIDFLFSVSISRVYALATLLRQVRRARPQMSTHRRGHTARTPLRSRSERLRGVHTRKPSRWISKFSRFISAYGVVRLAKELQIHTTAIYQWVRGSTAPRRTHAAIIQRLARESGVKLTLDQIYQHSRDLWVGESEPGAPSFQASDVGFTIPR